MSNGIIRAEGLGKKYRIGALQSREFQTLARRHRRKRGPSSQALFAAGETGARKGTKLLGVAGRLSGDVVGIVGRNGAGKSTLLKVLSRITEPAEGGVDIHGRVGSLLEVGTGFHPELTGRENTYLNGAILGKAWYWSFFEKPKLTS